MGTSVYFSLAHIENPFIELESILNNEPKADINIVDFHAETTSEKNCMLQSFNGKVTIIVGTHTHVQTNDAIIYNNTAYITDLGMTGPKDGIIGAKKDPLIEMFYGKSKQFRLSEEVGKYQLCGIVVTIDDNSNNPTSIENIFIREND